LLVDDSTRDYNNVQGITYKEAADLMQQQEYIVGERAGKGFTSQDACIEFAHNNHMDVIVYMKSLGTYRSVNHRGDSLTHAEWKRLYKDILFYTYEDDNGDVRKAQYTADNYAQLSKARIYGEASDGKYTPLYYRDYFVPSGYFNSENGLFNIARPFNTFAKETHADTSAIHTLLRHLAGECYPHLLSWLRHKLIYPTQKTEVIPVFTGEQGTGKSTFGEVICKALFGKDNVIVSYQYDSTSRFNSDQADALVVCIEEKTQEDARNTSGALKSSATATQVRKENKGVDPYYQDSYTDFVLSTNEFVPVKFEGRGNQRRFMIMEVDPDFTRERSQLADEVFTKLYGYNARGERVGKGMIEDKAMIEQFKFELLNKANNVNYRDFPHTDAYQRCFNIPRTGEAVEVETTIKALAPFIKASLEQRKEVTRIVLKDDDGQLNVSDLDGVVADCNAIEFIAAKLGRNNRVAVCKALTFVDRQGRPYSPSVVERILLDMRTWLRDEYDLVLLGNTSAPARGFRGITTKLKHSPAAWFILKSEQDEDDKYYLDTLDDPIIRTNSNNTNSTIAVKEQGEEIDELRQREQPSSDNDTDSSPSTDMRHQNDQRQGERVKYNGQFLFDPAGEFETLNEILPEHIEACKSCSPSMTRCKACPHNRRKNNAAYIDTFLLEADAVPAQIEAMEIKRAEDTTRLKKESINAELFYKERLKIQDSEAERLFKAGTVCRVVYSGSKSIHLLIRVKDSPTNLEERAWLDAYLKATVSDRLIFDQSTKDPTRLTRSPITKERTTYYKDNKFKIIGTQRLLVEDWNNLYDINWRGIYEAWKAAPPTSYEQRGRMLPAKPIYHEATKSILTGDYFTNKRWTGIRQETFFPAYRLLRAMGYSHDELWKELDVQIDSYSKINERDYWRTRKSSEIIKSIDKEFDQDV